MANRLIEPERSTAPLWSAEELMVEKVVCSPLKQGRMMPESVKSALNLPFQPLILKAPVTRG